ncbi:hypothetical protein BKA64DRAFT_644835 [Cadophora sp. MPI-SDFR-AT-0126]|nr:hypothetical protein BKA64DRAFT_644835 [Leotiomycetes sp. MPI-SDFR-AT-0126]
MKLEAVSEFVTWTAARLHVSDIEPKTLSLPRVTNLFGDAGRGFEPMYSKDFPLAPGRSSIAVSQVLNTRKPKCKIFCLIQSAMDENDFPAWKTCWQVNLLFHKRVSSKPLKCIVCSKTNTEADGSLRSTFWVEATRCSAGHRQVTFSETQLPYALGICAICDQNYMLDVVKGKHGCRREGCRRAVRVREAEVHVKLESDSDLLQAFLSIFKRYRVYECAIHCDEVPYGSNSAIALKPPTPQCKHDRNVCNACLKTTFEGAIRGGRLQDLVCLDTECRKPLPLGSLRQYVSAEVFKIYNKKLALALISKDEKFRWCRAIQNGIAFLASNGIATSAETSHPSSANTYEAMMPKSRYRRTNKSKLP